MIAYENYASVFRSVLVALMQASYSIRNCICGVNLDDEELKEWVKKEDYSFEKTVALLVQNAMNDQRGTESCSITIGGGELTYTTGGGLRFSAFLEPAHTNRYPLDTTTYYHEERWVIRCYANQGGTLEKALIENGFARNADYDDNDLQLVTAT